MQIHDRSLPTDLLKLLEAENDQPLAVVRRQDDTMALVLSGTIVAAPTLADIPLSQEEPRPDVLALVPYHQVRERGWEAQEGPEKLLCLVGSQKWEVPIDLLVAALPPNPPEIADVGFAVSDDEYAAEVQDIIEQEIGTGAGANFVIRRDYAAQTDAPPRQAVLAWLRQLLEHEAGAYWTFAWVGGGVACAGASPERHVSASEGKVLMNPISGTFRHQPDTPTVETLLEFLADRKESEELVMVVDEELKMMSVVCPDGGVMTGPYLKPMSRLTHTEYLLEGESALDPRDVLRLTMFAPTVIGSPMESACRVIARHEVGPRGYYSGVLALFEPEGSGYSLDAPILLRTAFLDEDGDITISAGATLVRHSDPLSEAKETRAKASGMLTALGLLPRSTAGAVAPTKSMVSLPEVVDALAERNRELAPFWRDEQPSPEIFTGTALVVDCGDDASQMLAHQLRHLGLNTRVVHWKDAGDNEDANLMVFGPGPGDPADRSDARVRRIGELLEARVRAELPTIATAFSHQVLASRAGLAIADLPESRQGLPLKVSVLGDRVLLGFYTTFAALGPDGSTTTLLNLVVESDPETQIVSALSGTGVVSVQANLESVLSLDGFTTLSRAVGRAFR